MFGKRIRQLRKERNMTLRDLSVALGIPFTTLGNYEREDRQPSLETLDMIATYFKVPIEFFLKGEDHNQILIKGSVQDIEVMLNKAKPEIKDVALRIFERMYSITSEEVELQNLKVLILLSKIVDFIFDIKDEFEFINDLPTIDEIPSLSIDQEKKAGAIATPYEMATKFLKEKNKIDHCFNELFEIYAKRNGF